MLSKKLIAWLGAGIVAAAVVPATHAAVRRAAAPSRLTATQHVRHTTRYHISTAAPASSHRTLHSSRHAAHPMAHSTAKAAQKHSSISLSARATRKTIPASARHTALHSAQHHSVKLAANHAKSSRLATPAKQSSHLKLPHRAPRAM